MKTKNKIFSIILALVIALGGFGIPAFVNGSAKAATEVQKAQSAGTLSIDYNAIAEAEFNLTNNNTIEFADYIYPSLGSADVYVSLWAPNGSQILDFAKVEADTSYKFAEPGLYALMYKLADANSNIFSKQYYVAVENDSEEIVLKETLSATAKTGSYVKVPTCTNANVNIDVFSPYGENVAINGGKFTNLQNVLGTYYIEYSKEIGPDGGKVKQYKYLTIEFGDNFEEPKTEEIKEETTQETPKVTDIVFVGDLKELSEDGNLYLFKNYALEDVQIEEADGDVVDYSSSDLKIQLKKIDSTGVTHFYDFESDEFVTTPVDAIELASLMAISPLYVEELDGIENLSDVGNEYELKYTSESYDLEKTITVKTKINEKAISYTYNGVFPDTIIVSPEESNANEYIIPEPVISIKEGYNSTALNNLISAEGVVVDAYFTDASNNKVEFETPVPGQDILYTIEKVSGGYKINFDELTEKAKSDFEYKLSVDYSVDFVFSAEKNISIDFNLPFTSKLSNKYNDDVKPEIQEMPKFDNIVYLKGSLTQFVVPEASASDNDNKGKSTNGVIIEVTVTSEHGTINTKPGQTITLEAGVYTFTYKFADTKGNYVTEAFKIKACKENRVDLATDVISSTLNMITYDESTNNYTFNFGSTNVGNALVYVNGEEGASPASMQLTNGVITSLNVCTEKDFVVVLSGRSANADHYISVSVTGKNAVTKVKPYSFNMLSDKKVHVAAGDDIISAKVGDRVLWLQNQSFKVETENGKYTIENGNEIVINYPGTYLLTNIDNGIETEVNATESKIGEIKYFLNMKEVVSSKLENKAERTIELQAPYIENYFGYSVSTKVVTSDGVEVDITDDNKFVVTKTDKYTITFNVNYLSDSKAIVKTLSSGEIIKPTIKISDTYDNITWTGEASKVYLIGATAVDKFGNAITNISVTVYDKYGKALEVKTDDKGSYVEVVDAGIYSVFYTTVDSDGFKTTEKVNFMVLYDEVTAEDKLTGWEIAGIVVASVVGAGLIALCVILFVRTKKRNNKFINKAKKEKKEKKSSDEKPVGTVLYTIAQSKNESEWLVKRGNRVIAKTASKEEAVAKINNENANKKKIKVYNRNGRLIDSID